VTAALAN